MMIRNWLPVFGIPLGIVAARVAGPPTWGDFITGAALLVGLFSGAIFVLVQLTKGRS